MKHLLRVWFAWWLLLAAGPAAAQTPGPRQLSAGLVAWLQLEEMTGLRALDASGSGKSGHLVNGGAWHAAGHSGGSVQGVQELNCPHKPCAQRSGVLFPKASLPVLTTLL